MSRKLASSAFLIVSIVIGLGAFGHGFSVRHVHAAIDPFPIDVDISTMLYVVWYFVSGCMFAFGMTLVWAWRRLRAGDDALAFVPIVIGALYAGIGVFGMVYRRGDPFMAFFIVLGGVLLLACYGMTRREGVSRAPVFSASGRPR